MPEFGRQAEEALRRLQQRLLHRGGLAAQEAISAGATSKAITFSLGEADALYGVIATPSWSTTCYVTNYATTGFTLNFGTAAPGGGGTVAWTLIRS